MLKIASSSDENNKISLQIYYDFEKAKIQEIT